jgi:hypothetical protein
MNDGAIGTSTDPSTIYAAELRYAKPSSKSMIILAGCDSFGGYPEPSTLARAVRKADVRGGYEVSVYTAWNQDYMGKLFTLMAEGMTIGDANNYIWETYRYTWAAEKGIDPNDLYMAKLRLYGNEDFKIV